MRDLVLYRNPTVETKIKQYLSSKFSYSELTDSEKCTVLLKLEAACKSCDLHYSSSYSNVPSMLNPSSKFLFIGRSPNGNEARENKLFPDKTKQAAYFKRYLEMLGIGQGEISVINMCNCYAKGNRPPTQEEINKCVSFRHLELEAIMRHVDIIFPMSQDALKWLYGLNSPGSLQCVGNLYVASYCGRQVLVAPLYHPSHLCMSQDLVSPTVRLLRYLAMVVKEVRETSVEAYVQRTSIV